MDNFRDFGDRIMTRYERARVIVNKLSKHISDLTIPLATYAKHHKDENTRHAIQGLIESPVEIAEIFDLLIKTDLIEALEFYENEAEEYTQSVESLMATIDELKETVENFRKERSM